MAEQAKNSTDFLVKFVQKDHEPKRVNNFDEKKKNTLMKRYAEKINMKAKSLNYRCSNHIEEKMNLMDLFQHGRTDLPGPECDYSGCSSAAVHVNLGNTSLHRIN